MKYVIGTGWWCDNPLGYEGRGGHQYVRSTAWHENVWLPMLLKYSKPDSIVVVDSASPVKPKQHPLEEWISLDRNYGVWNDETNNFQNGWIRGFLRGVKWADEHEVDLIYVEQDCLALGAGWVESIYNKSEGNKILYGGCKFKGKKPIPWGIQQSLVFIPHRVAGKFYSAIMGARGSCETRFKDCGISYKLLPFGYGRARPLEWDDKMFYAQRWTRDELLKLAKHESLPIIRKDLEAYAE